MRQAYDYWQDQPGNRLRAIDRRTDRPKHPAKRRGRVARPAVYLRTLTTDNTDRHTASRPPTKFPARFLTSRAAAAERSSQSGRKRNRPSPRTDRHTGTESPVASACRRQTRPNAVRGMTRRTPTPANRPTARENRLRQNSPNPRALSHVPGGRSGERPTRSTNPREQHRISVASAHAAPVSGQIHVASDRPLTALSLIHI